MVIDVKSHSLQFTPKAYGVKCDDGAVIWLPRSQVPYERIGNDTVRLTVPYWLALRYGHFDGYRF